MVVQTQWILQSFNDFKVAIPNPDSSTYPILLNTIETIGFRLYEGALKVFNCSNVMVDGGAPGLFMIMESSLM